MSMQHMSIIKRSGEHEAFSEEKVRHSMQRVGVPSVLQPQALQYVREHLRDNITTDELFSYILEFLAQNDKKSSLRFNLRQAIFDLGPTGFPFEKYLERVFQSAGYTTQVDVIMSGACVNHEIDLLIEKNGKKEIVEAKFHNQTISKTDIQVLLYTYARFLDVKEKNDIANSWVVTNTKLSADAIVYSQCKGMKALAWNYPEKDSLQDFVENPKMYPITIITALSGEEKRRLLEGDIVVCKDLLNVNREDLEKKYFINKARLEEALSSAAIICNGS